MVKYADDPETYRQLLEAKMKPAAIRATLAFAGIYQITHEMLKRSVLEQVKDFYCVDISESGRVNYEQSVLNLSPGNKFQASLAWLVEGEALTQRQADQINNVYKHRHELTHELVAFIVDPERNLDIDLFIEALQILKTLDKFWAQIEIDIGSFEHLGDVDVSDVVPLSTMVLQQCIDAYVDEYVQTPTAGSPDTE